MKTSTSSILNLLSDQQDIETQSSHSFINSKQKNLKIVIESFPEDIDPTSFNDQYDETANTPGLLEEYNKGSGLTCL